MSQEQTSEHCEHCQRRTLHARQKANHALHLLASVVTIGAWLPFWLWAHSRAARKGWMCQTCGSYSPYKNTFADHVFNALCWVVVLVLLVPVTFAFLMVEKPEAIKAAVEFVARFR